MNAISAIGAAALLCVAASSDLLAATDFYEGKTLKIIAGTASGGGGYDTHARLIARHLGKHIPGNPNVIVQNMPAGGGMQATNHVYAIADKDGTEIGLFNRNTLFAPMLGDNLAQYKSENFNWIGTPASYSDNAWVFFISAKLPQQTFEDLRRADPPLNIGNIGNVTVRVMQEALGAKIKLIGGYTGTQLDLAFERGEIDGQGTSYANIISQQPHWLSRNIARILVQFGRSTRLPALPDIPTGRELAKTPEALALIEVSELPYTLGFPMAAPPGVPSERVAILRKAFMATMEDPEYRADSQRSKMEYSPKDGERLQADLVKMVQTPQAVAAQYKKLVNQEKSGKT